MGDIREKAICNAIYFLYRMEKISRFKFLQADFVSSFLCSLIPFGELISILIDLSITRMCSWFTSSLRLLSPRERSLKLVDLEHVMCEYLKGTSTDLIVPQNVGSFAGSSDKEMHKILMEKIIMSQLINLRGRNCFLWVWRGHS